MASNQQLTPNPGSTPIGAHSPAWDSTNVDLSGGDYVPNVPGGLCRGFNVGGYASGTTPGNVTVLTAGGNTTTFYNVPPGTTIAQAFQKIFQSGTTATNIVAMI